MPAPTAVKKDETVLPAVQVPATGMALSLSLCIARSPGRPLLMERDVVDDDDVVLDAVPGVTLVALADDPASATIVSFDSDPDVNMDVDEESRPRFAASKDVEAVVRRESRKIRALPLLCCRAGCQGCQGCQC